MSLPYSALYKFRYLLRRRGLDVSPFRPHSSLNGYLCLKLFPTLHINCVLDVGAHHGEYAEELRLNGYKGRIVSFEPVRESFRILREKCSRDARWDAYNYALGSEDATREIGVSQFSVFSSFLSASESGRTFDDRIAVEHREVVDIRKLDTIFGISINGIIKPHVYLKMDTQGWDIEVLRGGSDSLKRVSALQSEMSVNGLYEGAPDYRETILECNRAGFVLSAMFHGSQAEDLSLLEFDAVLVRKS